MISNVTRSIRQSETIEPFIAELVLIDRQYAESIAVEGDVNALRAIHTQDDRAKKSNSTFLDGRQGAGWTSGSTPR